MNEIQYPLLVIGLATDDNVYTQNWTKSLDHYNIKYKLLGLGETFKGWLWRSKKYYNVLSQTNPNQIIVITDVYDVLFQSNADIILKTFHEIRDNTRVVFCVESGNWTVCTSLIDIIYPFRTDSKQQSPDSLRKRSFTSSDRLRKSQDNPSKFPIQYRERYKSINCGMIFGYADRLADIYKWIIDRGYDDDQIAISDYIKHHRDDVSFDKERILGFNLLTKPDLDGYELTDKGIRKFGDIHQRPCVVHYISLWDRLKINAYNIHIQTIKNGQQVKSGLGIGYALKKLGSNDEPIIYQVLISLITIISVIVSIVVITCCVVFLGPKKNFINKKSI